MYGGLMFISGWRGVGKSLLASQSDLPANIAFLDFEDKGRGWHEQLSFGLYHAPVMETGGKDYVKVWQLTEEIINDLEQDRYTVVVLDNISELERAITADVMAHPDVYAKRYGHQTSAVRKDSYGAARGCTNSTIAALVSAIHSKGVSLVIAIAHIAEMYSGGQAVPNKRKVRGRSRWQDLSVLTLILGRGDHPPIPSAIVQKESLGRITAPDLSDPAALAAIMAGEAGHTIQRRLPERMPECTFQKIRWYLSNPADLDNPGEGESSIPEELSVFSSTLSKEQISYVLEANKAAAEALEEDRATSRAVSNTGVNPLAQIAKAKAPAPQMSEDVQVKYNALLEKVRGMRLDMGDEEIRAALREQGESVPLILKALADSA
jgi:hypothetical protein